MTKSNSKNRKRRSKSSGKRRRRRRTVKVHKKFNRRRSRKNRRQKGGATNPFGAINRFFRGKKKDTVDTVNTTQNPLGQQPGQQQGQPQAQQKRKFGFLNGPAKIAGRFGERVQTFAQDAQKNMGQMQQAVDKRQQEIKGMMKSGNVEKKDLESTKDDLKKFAESLNKINTQLGKFVAWFNKAEENPSICPCCRRPFDDKGKGVDQKPPAQGPPPAPGAGPLPPAPGAGPLPQAPEAPPPQAPEAVPLTQVQGKGELGF